MSLDKLVDGYRLYCQAEAESPYTILWYMGKLRIFLQYLQKEGHSTEVDDLTSQAMRAFVVYLQQSVRAHEHNPKGPPRIRSFRLKLFRATYECSKPSSPGPIGRASLTGIPPAE